MQQVRDERQLVSQVTQVSAPLCSFDYIVARDALNW